MNSADLDKFFKFKIGDRVTLAATVAECQIHAKMNVSTATPACGVVIQRVLQECPGGVQIHYDVSGEKFKNSTRHEHELVDYDTLDFESFMDEDEKNMQEAYRQIESLKETLVQLKRDLYKDKDNELKSE